jgi:hypothetical protein
MTPLPSEALRKAFSPTRNASSPALAVANNRGTGSPYASQIRCDISLSPNRI